MLAVGALVEAAGLGGAWLPPALAVGFAVVFALPLIVGGRPSTTGGVVAPAAANRPHRADQDGLA